MRNDAPNRCLPPSADVLEYGPVDRCEQLDSILARRHLDGAGHGKGDIWGRLASISEILAEARAGRPFILVDSPNRENEGDIILPAQFATAAHINFMARYARGLICLAMTRERVDVLGLPPMVKNNDAPRQTAFTVSIEAAEGVTTGISAHDRATTVAVAVDPAKGAADLVSPGHIFPLVARAGGVLERAGHTEAAVDIARMAGLVPAGVICEVMNDDGTMARLPELRRFARRHRLRIASIEQLIAWRREHECEGWPMRENALHG